VDHDRAERLISERLDGERLSPRATAALERHLETCAECRAFERGAYRLREAARFEVAPAIPDLVEQIMTSVEAESRPAGIRVVRPMRLPRRRPLIPRLAPAIAAVLVGMLAGSLVVGGPWRDGGPVRTTALAAEDVTNGVTAAAASLDAYEARFEIVERNLSPDVPLRELRMRVWFRAPERFRLDVADRTDYPGRATPTNLQLIVNGDSAYSSGPAPCPSRTCPPRETSVRNRAPFSSHAPAPTDLVLPLVALAEPESFEVLRLGRALGRDAILVEAPFERVSSLFPFLSMGGDWRPFFANDRVRIWLDPETWFPLRWRVFPAGGPARDEWERRFGLEDEGARHAIFDVVAQRVRLRTPASDVFTIPSTRNVENQRARSVTLEEVPRKAGFEPVAPSKLGGLDLYRVAILPEAVSDEQTVVTYAVGLSFFKIGETRSWTTDAPFGLTDVRAEEVLLEGGSVAYYEPATETQGRRLSIHAAGTDLYVETNLPRERLLDAAASLPVTGLEMPDEWRVRQIGGALVERVSLVEAEAAVPFDIALPERLPAAFILASIELVDVEGDVGVTLYFRDAEVDVGAGMFRLHLAAARDLPPANSAHQSTVRIGEVEGRWTPRRSQLEWVVDGVYHSLDMPGESLGAGDQGGLRFEDLVAIATSIQAGGSTDGLLPRVR
jgi:outer membrane lipoprotein-sorting protein